MKKSYASRVEAYKNKASEEFRNYAGENGNSVGSIDPNDNTITVNVRCAAAGAAKARIFGAAKGIDESYNTANNAVVDIPESSHLEVKNGSMANPFRIKGVILTASNAAQLAQPLTLYYTTFGGAEMKKLWQPTKFADPRNNNSLMIKTEAFQMVVDANSRIELDLLDGQNISMVFTIVDQTDMSQALSRRSVVKSARGRY